MVRKLLRNAGLALILLPEPFTTPLGLALLGASYIFAHFSRVDTPAYLRGFIKMYLTESRLRGTPGIIQHKLKQTLSDSEWRYKPEKDIRCGIDASRLMLRFGKNMAIEFAEPAMPIRHDMKRRWAGYVWPGAPPDIRTTGTASHIIDTSHLSVRFLEDACGGSRKPVEKTVHHCLKRDMVVFSADTRIPEKTVTHSFDASRLSARFAESVDPSREAALDKAIYHSMKHDLYGYVLPSIHEHAETAVVHSMDSGRLLRHYEKTMSSRSAVPQESVVHTFNPAKVSLALGMG
ncbi:MAG: hypothetical protein Q7R50_00545 [Dehalococcoidales bacterium]|nr:hypothetical protein [Dehalococcoidales bacterium]